MTSKTVRVVSATSIAFVLLIAGALGPLRSDPSSGSQPVAPSGVGSLLAPAAAAGDLDDTIAGLQQRLRTETDDALSLSRLGLAYIQKARISTDSSFYPKAQEVLRRSLEAQPGDNFEAMVGLGALALARHDFKRALEWGGRARDFNPHNAQVLGLLGDAYLELGRYRAADRAFQDMIDLRPDLSSYARVSYARELRGDTIGAVEAMKFARSAAGESSDESWTGYQLGELFFNSGEYDRAKGFYSEARRLDPVSVLPAVGLARVAGATGDVDRAIRILKRVTRRQPFGEYLVLLGDLLGAADRPAEAKAQYELATTIAQLYRSNGVNVDLEQALFDADHGRAEDALRVARAEYERRRSVHVADALAWALHANGDYETAARFSREALRLGTRSALFHYHAGMIAMKLGRRAGAIEHLSTSLEINPHFSFLHAPLARRTLGDLKASL
ncbi:MAG: tetratricopeptide repeat protein [Actinomycetota bacterium]